MANDSDSSGIKKKRENVESQKVNKTCVDSGELSYLDLGTRNSSDSRNN